MAHEISEHHHAQEAPSPETSLASQIDPVCGMTVKPESPHASHYQGLHYRFCSAKCKIKFDAEPARYLAPSPVPAPVVGAEYVCPMHPEVRQPVRAPVPNAAWRWNRSCRCWKTTRKTPNTGISIVASGTACR
jgi:YHS domain-containing protein